MCWASQVAQGVKNLPAMQETQRDASSIPRSGRSPRGGYGKTSSVLLPAGSHVQGSMAGYSPECCNESDMTEETEHTLMQVSVLMSLGASILTVKEEVHNYGTEEVKKEPGI